MRTTSIEAGQWLYIMMRFTKDWLKKTKEKGKRKPIWLNGRYEDLRWGVAENLASGEAFYQSTATDSHT